MDISYFEKILALVTAPVYTIFITIEMAIGHFKGKKWYSWRDIFNNLLMGGLNVVIDIAVRFIFGLALLSIFEKYTVITWDSKNWLYWVLLFVLQDFFYYLIHVLEHRCRFFWAVHNIHHSSEFFNFTTALRSSVFQPIYKFPFYIPLILLGFKGIDIMLVYALGQTYGFFVHSSWFKRWKWIEWIMVTPSHHRVHHAKEPEYIDKNMSMVFIIWDKLFGTFTPENTNKPISFGITKHLEQNNPFKVVFHEWFNIWKDVKHASTWKERWMYIFGPPGWQPTHELETTEEQTASIILYKNDSR
ncbi:MAG: sterol desaturase family protein [Raineya sp.]|jgi:sterol desaturase/sphingolipid hydroxylase (fatty acid hydroxylase superfamily)|nr:sterol desaturase family protein [Raineya sp.]